jgi:hypothetical protein
MNRASIWWKRRAEAASGAPDFARKKGAQAIFAPTDSKVEKKPLTPPAAIRNIRLALR